MTTLDLINECLGAYVNHETHIGRQAANYIDIRHELTSLEVMSECYTRKWNELCEKYLVNPDSNQTIQEDDLLPITSMATHIVIAYSRCFDSAKVPKGEPVRRVIKLNSDFLKEADPVILETHNRLIQLRNTVVAHIGVNELERFDFVIGLNRNGGAEIRPADDNRRVISNPYVETDRIKPLVAILIKKIDDKLTVLMEKLNVELETLTNKGDYLLRKIHAKQPITDRDLKM